MGDKTIPRGLCQCGCGEQTTIAVETSRREDVVKGQPRRFVHGHNGRSLAPFVEDSAMNCWVWQGGMNDHGYGRIKRKGRMEAAHRAYYEDFVGPIPDGLTIDHLCRNRACVNPGHLEPVTMRENVRRARKTHCKHGHLFDEANTYVTSAGARHCRACNRAAMARYTARKRAGVIDPHASRSRLHAVEGSLRKRAAA